MKNIEKDGWVQDRTRGSHRPYAHPTKPGTGTVTIPGHPGDDLPPGLLNSILKQAGLEEMKRYAAVFEKAPHNWGAHVPDLPGCVSTGKTLEETRTLIAEAIQFHIEGLRLHGLPVPGPSARAEEIETGDAA